MIASPPQEKVVLVLDDDPGVAMVCKQALERKSFEVISLMDSEKAIRVLKQARIDLLLVDIRMPVLDGFQVMELARENQPDLAVVMMTAYGTLETATRALRMGADGLILKPFESTNDLVETVRKAINDREVQKENARLQAIQPLLEISKGLFSETKQEKLAEQILDAVCDLLKCSHAGFYAQETPKNGSGLLKLEAQVGKPLPGEPSKLDGGPVARADAWGSGLLVDANDLENPNLAEYITNHGFESVMCVPSLRGKNGNIVLMAGREIGEPGFSAVDQEMFTLLASQAGVALENARLYADLLITFEHMQEQQQFLIQAEKMAAIGRLTASIAHEVNNPLQAVRNCLHLAGRNDLVQEKKENYLVLAQDELDRLMNTVQQMLDFFRPSALLQEWVDIHDLIQSGLSLLDSQLAKKNIQVHFRKDGEVPELFLVRNQMQQVFFNMLLNAMDAIGENGRVDITTCVQHKKVEVLFEDDGPGVPEDKREHIFEPFVSSKPKGVGLGLSVSFMIVDANGGTLELLEEEGHLENGARFRITLPIVEDK